MDKKTEFNYFVVLTVLMLMVSIHNLIKSILLYCENNSKISSVIKIIFNISGIACGNSENQINDENNLENGDYKGKNVPKSTSNETSISDDDVVLRASNGMLVDMPLKNVRDEIKMEQKYKIEKLDPNGDIGLVKQSLSFYEIASMFLGKDSKRQSY
ncbi:hypothetical protein C1645_742429 [Glomus cerebriforme]|uniref:Uncharacterized protein n=1 Tax=Glomus cerebriforme TaxID=658196 RepID=A0A397SDG3_9GLOM|nr:hypothetical protein C1645_742429 [Glomus cerebriforme]